MHCAPSPPLPRQLESMIRLSEAEARLHLSPEVREEHVRQPGPWPPARGSPTQLDGSRCPHRT